MPGIEISQASFLESVDIKEKIRRALILDRNQFPAFIEVHGSRIVKSITTLKLIC